MIKNTELPFLFGEIPTIEDRRIAWTYEGPSVPEDEAGDTGWNRRIVIVVQHDKNRKAYRASVRRCMAATRTSETGGFTYTMERTEIFGKGDHALLASSDPVARYSDKGLATFAFVACQKALAVVKASADGSLGEPTVLEALLNEAISYDSPARRLAGV